LSKSSIGHDLLFGLLALQNGLINQSQLVAAFQAWSLDKARPLSLHLEERGDLDADSRAALNAMVELHLKKHGGETDKSLAAIPAGHSTRECLGQIGDPDIAASLACVGTGSAESIGDPHATMSYAVGTATSAGQRFRVLRPHARGGLGAVFVALDGELNREVALKEILDAHADDPISRQRFLIEAEITGGLEHPGIVPVYGLGCYAEGRPYYAMRFVKGDNLKEAIAAFHGKVSADQQGAAFDRRGAGRTRASDTGQRSLELRQLLRRFTDVCNAIGYAHSRGVLHRDIKPGNIIVGKHGETLVVDWGLAKAKGRADSSEPTGEHALTPTSARGSEETMPGSTLGTPAYMSPEQARGELERLGFRSDVYSLGATLYSLVTGRPPFEGKDREEVLRKVQRGEFMLPRQLNPALDQAMEAVCLKAMATRPEDRYQSCQALAEDIERWAADEPVTAWQEPWSWRARRWLARHRSLVASAAAALVIVAVVSATAAILIEKARRDKASALEARTEAMAAEVQAKAEADRRLKDANQVVETFLSAVSDDLERVQGAQPVRLRLLRDAADYFSRVARERSSDPVLEYEAARAAFRSGRVRRLLGTFDAAIAGLHDAARRGEALLRVSPKSQAYLKLLANTEIELGVCMMHLGGRTDDEEAAYRRAIVSFNEIVTLDPDDTESLNNLASAHNNLGNLLQDQSARGETEYRRAIELRRSLTARRPNDPKYWDDLGSSLTNFGILRLDRGQLAEAVELQRESVAVRQRSVELAPENPQYLRGLALSRGNLGAALGSRGKNEEAVRVFQVANAELWALVKRNPDVPSLRVLKSTGLVDLTEVLSQLGRHDEAVEASSEALRECENLARATPASLRYRFGLGVARLSLARALNNLKRFREAEAQCRRACDEFDVLVTRDRTVSKYNRSQGLSHLTLGEILHHLGNEFQAEAALRKAIEILNSLARTRSDLHSIGDDLAGAYESLASFHSDQGRAQPLLDAVDEAMVLRRDARERAPDLPQPRDALAKLHLQRGEALLMLRRPDEAAAEADRLVRLRPGQSVDLVNAARLLSRAAGSINGKRAETHAVRALECLQGARGTGPVDAAKLADDQAFAPIRPRPEFHLLLLDLAFPDQAFAR
jgi:serine/threonine-protein kinase